MIFVHQDAEFRQLVQIVARSTGIAAALIERFPLDEACDTIRAWLGKLRQNR